MPELHVVTVSTRPSRLGPKLARWMVERAQEHGGFDVVPVDLAEVNLPLHDEPEHPRFKRYHHAHTKAWSASVERADAFVFVTPEYNYFPPPSLVNAVDYLFGEWAYKPVGLMTYGGVSAGTRSAQMTRLLVSGLKMAAIPEAVNVPMFTRFIADPADPASPFAPEPGLADAAKAMLNELARWEQALRGLRRPG